MPALRCEAARDAAAARLPEIVDLPAGAMNSPALLAEIARAVATRGTGERARTSST